jgi:hypothetical protein
LHKPSCAAETDCQHKTANTAKLEDKWLTPSERRKQVSDRRAVTYGTAIPQAFDALEVVKRGSHGTVHVNRLRQRSLCGYKPANN